MVPAKKLYQFEQFTAIRRYGYGGPSFSPDGAEVAYTVDTSGQFNLWKEPLTGGYPIQLTMFVSESVRTIAWSPDGRWIAFNADRDGDEFHQLYLIPPQGGMPEQLTHTPKVQNQLGFKPWSPDGRYLAYSANDREPTAVDVLLYDLQAGASRRVLSGDAAYTFGSWAPDSLRLLAMHERSNTNTDIYLVDLRDGSSRLLTPHPGEAKFYPGPWSADGKGFYLLTDFEREYIGLAYYNLDAGRWNWVESPEKDIESVDGSQDGRLLAYTLNHGGYSRLIVRDLSTGDHLPLPEIPGGVIDQPALAPSGDRLAFILSTPIHSQEVMTIDLGRMQLNQITYSMLGGVDENDLVAPEPVEYPTFDDRSVSAWLYRPLGAGEHQKLPVVVSIHGGPEAQERPGYMYAGFYQYLLSRGIGVIAPNIRGSTGYGKSYQMLIHRDWGGGELKDIDCTVQYLQTMPWVDASRIAVFGGSFGGFATLSAVSRLPDAWAAAVDIFGPSNLVTFVRDVPPFWRRFMDDWIGNPEKDHDMLVERSPITYVDQIKAPLFIIQGANDMRVVKSESDQIVARLRERGVAVRYDIYADEGHGFTKRENELKVFRDVAGFFEKHLLQ